MRPRTRLRARLKIDLQVNKRHQLGSHNRKELITSRRCSERQDFDLRLKLRDSRLGVSEARELSLRHSGSAFWTPD